MRSIYVVQDGCYAGGSSPSKFRIDTTDGMIAEEASALYHLFLRGSVIMWGEKGERKI